MSLSKEQVHEVMIDVQPDWRYRWCGGGPCGCMGCSNVSGGVTSKGVTKEQWGEWVTSNPEPFEPDAGLLEILKQSTQQYTNGQSCTSEELKDRLRKKFQQPEKGD